MAFPDFFNWEDHSPSYEEGPLHLKALNQTGGQRGKGPLLDPYVSVPLSRALERGTKAKEFEQYSRTLAKQMKSSLNFFKEFIGPTDIILQQIPRPWKYMNGQFDLLGQTASDTRRKLQKSDRTFGMNPSRLVDVAFIKYSTGNNKGEIQNKKPLSGSDARFLEGGNSKEKQVPLEQCAHSEEEQHWRTDCPLLKQKENN